MEEVIENLKKWAESNGWIVLSVADRWFFGKVKEISLINDEGHVKHYRVYKSGFVSSTDYGQYHKPQTI